MKPKQKYTYEKSLKTAVLKKTPVKKHIGPALPKNGMSTACGQGRHGACYAATCKCPECQCSVNI